MAIRDDHCVVSFAHIDDYRCLRPLGEAVCDDPTADPNSAESHAAAEKLRSELEELFKEAGWEGDGEIECIFMAPCFVEGGYGNCTPVYHVKQSNNGTSWLAIPSRMKLALPEKPKKPFDVSFN